MSDQNIPADDTPPMPVRRLHNYSYCPRLFYLQWVENLFEENADTVAGSAAHRRVDAPSAYDEEKAAALAEGLPQGARLRSLQVESENLGLVGVIDLVEGSEAGTKLVDYKKGAARRMPDGTFVVKEYDAVQIAAYALLLREQGVFVSEASVYYAETRRHVPVSVTQEALDTCLVLLAEAKTVAAGRRIPAPLVNDPRCRYCSAYPICLPVESHRWALAKESAKQSDTQLRLLTEECTHDETDSGDDDDPPPPPRPEHDEGEVLVVQKAGAVIGQRGGEFTVSLKDETLRKLPLHQVRAIYIYGSVQVTAHAVETALENGIDVAYFAASGRFLGTLRGLPLSGVDARRGQYALFDNEFWRLRLARASIRAKISNQRTLLMRNGEASKAALARLADLRDAAAGATEITGLLGLEGAAAAIYFESFASMFKGDEWKFDFTGRNRRPPRDPVNAMLSLAYSMMAKELTGVCHTVGLDPFFGFFHRPRYGRPALALDLMEEFRPIVADSVVIALINRGEIDMNDFIRSARGCSLNDKGRKRFWEAWFRRLDTEVTHPEFGYKMSYRRMFEVQARQLWRFVRAEVPDYHPFTTR